jgi:hypothetical protein
MTEYRNEMKYIIDPQTAHVLQRRRVCKIICVKLNLI